MKRIFFVRHGQTYLNTYNRVQGWIDSPLTELGESDAEKVGRTLASTPFVQAWSSDSGRAIKTRDAIVAQNVAKKTIVIHTSPAFREVFMGYFEGMYEPQMWELTAMQAGNYHNQSDLLQAGFSLDQMRDFVHDVDPLGQAENSEMFWNRALKGLDEISSQTKDGNYLVVSHGLTIRSFIERFAPGKFDLKVAPGNGSISIMTIDDSKQIDFESYNQQSL